MSVKYKQIRRDRTVSSQCNFTLFTKRKQSILHANRVKYFPSGIRRAKPSLAVSFSRKSPEIYFTIIQVIINSCNFCVSLN